MEVVIMMNFITNIVAWLLKNVNLIVGMIKGIAMVAAGIINIFAPSKDDLVDTIETWSERLQKWLFKSTEILKKFGSSTG